jgi:plasmid stabilization system protein ParE
VKLRVDPAALEELLQAEDYTSREFGATVVNDFRLINADALEEIAEFPEHYTTIWQGVRAKVLSPYPFSIIYEEVDDTVRVYAIAHAKRRPGYWRKRM